jgi:hypothetical protein
LGLEFLQAPSQVGHWLLPAGELLLLGQALEVAEDAVGLAVQALSGDALLIGVAGDVAVLAEEDNGPGISCPVGPPTLASCREFRHGVGIPGAGKGRGSFPAPALPSRPQPGGMF